MLTFKSTYLKKADGSRGLEKQVAWLDSSVDPAIKYRFSLFYVHWSGGCRSLAISTVGDTGRGQQLVGLPFTSGVKAKAFCLVVALYIKAFELATKRVC